MAISLMIGVILCRTHLQNQEVEVMPGVISFKLL